VLLAPDGESIAYLGLQGVLKRIATTDGRPSLIAQDATRGMSWAADGTIVFSTRAGDLARVSVSDPVPEVLVQAPDGQRYSQPHLLPDGGAMLFVVTEGDDRGDYSEARIVALSLDDGEKRSLTDGMAPLVTTRGQLLFAKDGSVWAVNFDRNRLQVVGTPTPVLNDVEFALGPGPIFSVADNGAMVYLPKLAAYRLAWMTREGSDAHEIPMPMSPAVYAQPQISPDGRSVLLRVHKPNTSQLWRYSFDRGTLTKLHDNAITFLWSADSSTIYYSRVGDGQVTLVRRKADGTGTEEVLIDNERDQFPTSRSRDGDAVFYHECDDYVSACDIGRLTIISGEPFGELLLNGEYSERAPAASPNGRWLAYESDQSGRYEIYVRPYPDLTAGRWQISKDGGRNPVWSPDAGTLYYEAGLGESRQIFAVSVSSDDEFSAGIPEYLFEFRSAFLMGIVRNHDLHPDGSRFLVATPDERQSERLIYVENWLDEVERLAPRDL
jgi:serine/threonine-protein kinase